jgi:hypothetical protein
LLRVVLSLSKDEAPEGSAEGAAERERAGVGPRERKEKLT